MKKVLFVMSIFLMLVCGSVGFAEEAVVPEETIGDTVEESLKMAIPPGIISVLPPLTSPPAPGEGTPLIRNNGFGVDFSPFLPNFNEISVRTGYASKHFWYGEERSNDAVWTVGTTYGIPGNLLEGTVLDGTRLFFDAKTIQQASSDNIKQSEAHYTLFSVTTVNPESNLAMEITTKNTYYDFIDQSSEADGQEFGVQTAFPNILADENQRLVPSYYVGRIYESRDPDGPMADSDGGNVHVFGADWYLNADENLATDLHVFGNMTYLDAVSGADSEMSYATGGVDYDFDLGNNTYLTPYVQVIKYMDDSVDSKRDCTVYGGMNINLHF
jgi:hypothetical protein